MNLPICECLVEVSVCRAFSFNASRDVLGIHSVWRCALQKLEDDEGRRVVLKKGTGRSIHERTG